MGILLHASGCTDTVGTVTIELAADPSSDLLERLQSVQVKLSNPPQVANAERNSNGTLSLQLEVDARGEIGNLSLEAFDRSNQLIGVAHSPPLPISAIDGLLTLHVAPPLSMSNARNVMDSVRTEMAVTALSFGAIMVGGRTTDGSVSSAVVVYNVYNHDFQIGKDLPLARAQSAIFSGASNRIYLFGGTNSAGNPLARATGFNTTVAPAGSYVELTTTDSLARSGATAVSIGPDLGIVGGGTAVVVDGIAQKATELPGAFILNGTLTQSKDIVLAVGAGTATTGAARVNSQSVTEISAPAQAQRTGHRAVTLGGDDVLIIGGSVDNMTCTDGLRYLAASDEFTVVTDLLPIGRNQPAVAVSDRYIIVAGGMDQNGDIYPSVDVIRASDLSPVATLALTVPRTDAHAIALANGQVLIAGGRDLNGDPIAILELFTPDLSN